MIAPYYSTTRTVNNVKLLPLINTTAVNTNPEVVLVPKTSKGIIDIRSDFVWTMNPTDAITKTIPSVFLTERTQEQNSLVSSILYYLNAIDPIGNLSIAGTSIANSVNALATKTLGSEKLDQVTKFLGDKGTDFKACLNNLKQKITANIGSDEDRALLNTDFLKSYIGIYFTKKTGFNYILPYYNDQSFGSSNTWNETQQNLPFLQPRIKAGMEAVERIAATMNFTQPGTYIEKPKYFNYPGEGETFNVTFNLYNTYNLNKGTSFTPYQQNYELLWMLAYQNKPYRTSFSRILPPKLYTLNVPGLKYFPYCFISTMNVDFIGTRRNLDVTLPTGSTISTPIPDAYKVTITFKSLLADVGNLMVTQDFGSKINTASR